MRMVLRSVSALAISATLLASAIPALAADPVDDPVTAALGQLDSIVEEAMATTGVPGVAVAVVHGDETVFARGYGVRNAESGEPVDAETVFQVASLSKPMSSTVVAGLVDDGHIDWDQPVVQVAPDFALADPWVSEHVTFADLLAMRSGLPGQAGNELESIGFDRSQILERLRLVELAPFRDSYSYSNFGYTAGGELAARAAGISWEDASASRLFEPAGMTSTSARHEDFMAQPNRAALHVQVDGAWSPDFERMPDAQAPAGGNSSNVIDLARWLRLMLGNGELEGQPIIDADALAAVTTPAITKRPPPVPGAPAGFYGLGWNVEADAAGNQRWNHSGAFSVGAATSAVLVPALDVGIVVLTNAQPVGVAEAIADSFLELVERGEISQDWVSVWGQRFGGIYGAPIELPAADAAMTPRETSAYVGTYTNDYAGPIEIVVAGEGLDIALGPARETRPLSAIDGATFSFVPDLELPDFREVVHFSFDGDGEARSIDVSMFEGVGHGIFPRS